MQRFSALTFLFIAWVATPLIAQQQPKPNINASKEFSGVYHSPSADSTPSVFRSVLQMEIVVKPENGDATVRYANGVVLSRDGLVVSVIDEPVSPLTIESIESATILLLDGGATQAELLQFDSGHGLALFRVAGLRLPPLNLSKNTLVAQRRLNWHAVFREGRKTFLYSRPVQIHKAQIAIDTVDGFCEVIDTGSSSLTADRSGSALLSLDGRLVALMGRQPHWNVSPKDMIPRTKVAVAIPAEVIADLLSNAPTE